MLCENVVPKTMRILPDDFVPSEDDVIIGRGRRIFEHKGNVRLRQLVAARLREYSDASSKFSKSYILRSTMHQARFGSTTEGCFVKKDPESGRWYEVGDFIAREMISQSFRDALHKQYKSSNTAKKRRRWQKMQPNRLFSTEINIDKSSAAPSPSHRPSAPVRSISSLSDIVGSSCFPCLCSPSPEPTPEDKTASLLHVGNNGRMGDSSFGQSDCQVKHHDFYSSLAPHDEMVSSAASDESLGWLAKLDSGVLSVSVGSLARPVIHKHTIRNELSEEVLPTLLYDCLEQLMENLDTELDPFEPTPISEIAARVCDWD
jgi:hypothetical protein